MSSSGYPSFWELYAANSRAKFSKTLSTFRLLLQCPMVIYWKKKKHKNFLNGLERGGMEEDHGCSTSTRDAPKWLNLSKTKQNKTLHLPHGAPFLAPLVFGQSLGGNLSQTPKKAKDEASWRAASSFPQHCSSDPRTTSMIQLRSSPQTADFLLPCKISQAIILLSWSRLFVGGSSLLQGFPRCCLRSPM